MTAAVKLFWDICLLRSGPERAPAHPWLIAVLIAIDLVLVGTLYSKFSTGDVSVSYPFLALALTGAILWAALYARGMQARFARTFAAIIGCDIIIAALMGVALTVTGGQDWVGVPFNIWSIVVMGFIVHRALDVPIGTGILIAIAISIAGLFMGIFVLGSPAGATS